MTRFLTPEEFNDFVTGFKFLWEFADRNEIPNRSAYALKQIFEELGYYIDE